MIINGTICFVFLFLFENNSVKLLVNEREWSNVWWRQMLQITALCLLALSNWPCSHAARVLRQNAAWIYARVLCLSTNNKINSSICMMIFDCVWIYGHWLVLAKWMVRRSHNTIWTWCFVNGFWHDKTGWLLWFLFALRFSYLIRNKQTGVPYETVCSDGNSIN